MSAPLLLLLASPSADLDREALADAIRVQVLDLGVVVEVEEEQAPGPSLRGRLASAVERMEARDAPMALFYDRAPGDPWAVLYVARRSREDALVTTIRLPADPGPSLYRSFALRVRELVADLSRLERDRRASVPVPVPVPEPDAPRDWAIDAGYSVAWPPALGDVQHGPEVGILRFLRSGLELHADLSLLVPSGTAVETGTADLSALALRAGLREMGGLGRVRLGGGVRAGASLFRAQGETLGRRTGEAARAVPAAGVDFVLRIPVAGGVALEGATVLEALLVRQRFRLAGETAFDLGRLLLSGSVSLVISLL